MAKELTFYYNMVHQVCATITDMTGEALQTHTLRCSRANEIIRKTWDRALGKEGHGDLFLIRYCRQRRLVVDQLLGAVLTILRGCPVSGNDTIQVKRVRFLAKCVERHLRSLERTLRETEVQLHLGAVQLLHGAPEIQRAGGKKFLLQFLSAN